ncbi:MAG: hypothetical protein AB7C91_11225 [Sphaerochaeta sp.]|uniref:hypothetical protein n=1 Tax=Sphaerochaeta sp. TaxID=1972642 RepID=UPI003D137D9F
MKFEVSHQDRSVIIALGTKLKDKQGGGFVTPPIPLFLMKDSSHIPPRKSLRP